MNEIVYRGESNQPLTNSKLVAEVFGKPHKVVLVAIRNILEGSAQNCAVLEMFSESTYLNEQNKEQPMFIMNQDGFTLLAMGILPLIEQENTPSDKGTGRTEPAKAASASQQTIKFN